MHQAPAPVSRFRPAVVWTVLFGFFAVPVFVGAAIRLHFPSWPCNTRHVPAKAASAAVSSPNNPILAGSSDPENNSQGNAGIKSAAVRSLPFTCRHNHSNVTVSIPPAGRSTFDLPLCGPVIAGHLQTEDGKGLEGATINLIPAESTVNPIYNSTSACPSVSCSGACTNTPATSAAGDGGYGFCSICTTCNKFEVVPVKNNDPLNGVSTFDLVLINKHILGLEPLNSPYKIIAADANYSHSLSTFDIVELRKLILGIYTQLPNSNSWRFIDKAFQFQNPANPFQPRYPESINCVAPPQNNLDFVAVKVGDVNGNAVPRPARRPVVTLGLSPLAARGGETVTIPVAYTGAEPLEAIQIGLRFDPAKLALIGPSRGELPGYTADNFGLARAAQGEIRTLWLPLGDESERINPGATLFYLSFRALSDVPESEGIIRLDDQVLPNAAWKPDGVECALAPSPKSAKRDNPDPGATAPVTASVRPNPATGAVEFVVQAPKAEKGRIALFDAFSKLIFMRNIDIPAGGREFPAPEVASLPAGVYVWNITAGRDKVSGHLIKQ